MRTRTARTRGIAAVATAGIVTLALALPASADGHHHGPGTPTVVASGLDNPRQLSFTRSGDLYVAEAGAGGTSSCVAGPEGDTVCFGTSGAITKLSRRGVQSRVVTGLPSIAGQGTGAQASGPSDVLALPGGALAVLIGLGGNPTTRAALPAAGRIMGTLQLMTPGGRHRWQVADLAAFEARTNPIHDVDSNPVGLSTDGWGRFVVADAGGNTVVSVGPRGLRDLAVLPDQDAQNPFGPGTVPAQAVPTSAVRGPDGALYVSQLTGFPFQAGLAKIYRVDRHGHVSVYASGLTNVTDLAFAGRTLYAVQISTGGLLATGPVGSLVKVRAHSTAPTIVLGDLFAPYGLAIRGGAAYVTTGSVAPGAGQVLRVPLG